MAVLVTGADGYLAQHIVQYLRTKRYRVTTSTRNRNGDLVLNFGEPNQVSNFRVDGIDAVIHTASPKEELFRQDVYRAVSENAAGIHGILDFCVYNHIKTFIYLSSFHVFGQSGGLLTESTPPAPITDYGLAHFVAEQTVEFYNRQKKVNGWIIRPSNVFGVPVDLNKFSRWYLVPFAFCKEAVEKNEITLKTAGTQLRNFVGAEDLCKKMLWVLQKQPVANVIHAFGKETMSIYHFALLVQKVAMDLFGIKVRINRPAETNLTQAFDFRSDYEESFLNPESGVEEFIEQMIQVLLNERKTHRTDI